MIVKGKKGDVELSDSHYQYLYEISKELSDSLKKPIQLEFVIDNFINRLYIVQLRILENHYEETVIKNKPTEGIIYEGLTFSKGVEELDSDKILVVEEDCDSHFLLDGNYSALIVENEIPHSHILALSKALKIPSMYGTGKVDLSKYKKVKFVAYNKKSWIELI